MGHVYFSIFSLIISVLPEMISFLAFRSSLFSFLATYLPTLLYITQILNP